MLQTIDTDVISQVSPAKALKPLKKELELVKHDQSEYAKVSIDHEAFKEALPKYIAKTTKFISSQAATYNTTPEKMELTVNELTKNLKLLTHQKDWLYRSNITVDGLTNVHYGATSSGKSYTQAHMMLQFAMTYHNVPTCIIFTAPTTITNVLQANESKFFRVAEKNINIKKNTLENSEYLFTFNLSHYRNMTPRERKVVDYWVSSEYKSVFVFDPTNKQSSIDLTELLKTKKHIAFSASSYYIIKYFIPIFETLGKDYFEKFKVLFSSFDEGHRFAHSSCMQTMSMNTSMSRGQFSKKPIMERLFSPLYSLGFTNNVFTGTPSKEQRIGPMKKMDFRDTLKETDQHDKKILEIIDKDGAYQKFLFHDLPDVAKCMISLKNSPLGEIISITENFKHNYGDKPIDYTKKEFKNVLAMIFEHVCFSKKGITMVKIARKNRTKSIDLSKFEDFIGTNLSKRKNEILIWVSGRHCLANSKNNKQFKDMRIETVLELNPQIKMIVIIDKLSTGTSINNVNSVVVMQEDLSKNNEFISVEQFIGRGVRPSDEDLSIVFLNIRENEKAIIHRVLVERQTILPREDYDKLKANVSEVLEESSWLVTDEMAEEFRVKLERYFDKEFIGNVKDQLSHLNGELIGWENNDGYKWSNQHRFDNYVSESKQDLSTALSKKLELRVHEWCPNAVKKGGSGNREDMDIKLGNTWLALDFKCSTRVKLSTSPKYYLESMALKDGTRTTNDGQVSNAMIYLATRLFIDEQLDKFDIVVDLVEFNGWESRSILDSQLLQSSDKHRVRNLFTISETV